MKFGHLTLGSNTYKSSFKTRTITEWNSEVIDQSSLEVFKASLDTFSFQCQRFSYIYFQFFSLLHLR